MRACSSTCAHFHSSANLSLYDSRRHPPQVVFSDVSIEIVWRRLAAIGTRSARVSVLITTSRQDVQRDVQGQCRGKNPGLLPAYILLPAHPQAFVILSPGIYTETSVDCNHVERVVTLIPRPACAIWHTDADLASGRRVTTSASIDLGRGDIINGKRPENPLTFREDSNRNWRKCKSLADAMPPTASIRRCGAICNYGAGGTQCLVFRWILSGLNKSCNTIGRMASGKRIAFNSSTYCACTKACWRFFSTPAKAAFNDASGAAL
ncbi:hypothetical protein FQR65_LT20890 [Abscondita terminalis]|nr:hypothetical protein FQR65_LT20890 [Abscondita terminalis]